MNNINDVNEDVMVEAVLAEFRQLAKIPRPSGHEQQVSDYLRQTFTDMGCQVVQDEVFNIIADMPATQGWEQKPLVAMQAHMDMVCVAAEGVEYDPLHDPIKLVQEGDFLHADGTSLGADDGMGIAIIIYIMKNLATHGPLRAIITVDEEKGMTGSEHLAAEYLQDVEYLINCDSEDWDLLTVGSAGSGDITFSKSYTPAKQQGKSYQLKLQGLLGGHSGEEINCGRANAIKSLAQCLSLISRKTEKFALTYMAGGRAKNVIPSAAEAYFTCEAGEKQLEEILAETREDFLGIYGDVEEKPVFLLKSAVCPSEVMPPELGDSLLKLLLVLPHGVSAMSQICSGMVETSANIGVVETDTEKHEIRVQYMPRSSREHSITAIYQEAKVLADLCDMQVAFKAPFPSWQERKHSKLSEIMQQVFKEQNGMTMRVSSIHAGLECSYHLQKNPALDVVSIGTNNNDIHSPKETLELKTVAPQVRLIAETLQRL